MKNENKSKNKLLSEIKEQGRKINELEQAKEKYKEEKKELIQSRQFYKNILNSFDDLIFLKNEHHK